MGWSLFSACSDDVGYRTEAALAPQATDGGSNLVDRFARDANDDGPAGGIDGGARDADDGLAGGIDGRSPDTTDDGLANGNDDGPRVGIDASPGDVDDGGPPNALDGGLSYADARGDAEAVDGPVAPVIDVYSLLDEMSDLERLAHPARQRFRTFLASSYDRSSVTPAVSSDTPTGWYANDDRGNFYGAKVDASGSSVGVMLEVDGPGCITRIWSATPDGTVRIYLDYATTPTLEVSMGDLLSGQIAPFLPPFAGVTAGGGNLEFPIPFQKHVKITWDDSHGYYQVTYRIYEDPSTVVQSFDLASLDTSKLNLAKTRLLAPILPAGNIVNSQAVLTAASPELTIEASPAGEEVVALQVNPTSVDASSLRSSVLSLRFDGKETVRAPLGDFFGAGPGLLPHATLPLAVSAGGQLTARFVMPFATSAVVRIDAAAGLEATVTATHRAAVFDGGTYYFHAHWSARGPMSVRPFRDILLADLVGEGSYVGTFLAVGNSSTAWWGEGDEKVWVDDDTFPSLFGTGTEDYFGQGTCSPELYNHPFRAQTLAAGDGLVEGANGLFSMLRTHILDPIRFSTALQFDMELWHWDESAQVTFDNVSYFYLATSATDNLPLPTAQDFRLSPLGQ
jgi:hypothetical protein